MKQARLKKRRRFDSDKIKTLAERLSLTERRVRQLIAHGTSSPETAAILAEELGTDAVTFLKPARPVGRPRRNDYPFKDFILDRDDKDINERIINASASVRELVSHLRKGYRRNREIPADFASLSHLDSWAAVNPFLYGLADALLDLWRLFRIWKVRRKAAEDIFDIEMGNDDASTGVAHD